MVSYDRVLSFVLGTSLLIKSLATIAAGEPGSAVHEIFSVAVALVYLFEAFRGESTEESAGKFAFHFTAGTVAIVSILHGCAGCPDVGRYLAECKAELALYAGIIADSLRSFWKFAKPSSQADQH